MQVVQDDYSFVCEETRAVTTIYLYHFLASQLHGLLV